MTSETNVKHIAVDALRQMTGGEGLILQGCGGNPQDWVDSINDMLTEAGVLLNEAKFTDISVFEREGLTNIMFGMDDMGPDKLAIGKLAVWRLQTHEQFHGMWLSDYLPNRLGVNRDERDAAPEHKANEPPLAAVTDTDLAVVLAEIHAVGGYGARDLKRNLQILANGGDVFFVIKHGDTVAVASVESLFFEDCPERAWLLSLPVAPDEPVVMMTVAERADGRILGSVALGELAELQASVRDHWVSMAFIDAEFKGGEKRTFTADEWRGLPPVERDNVHKLTTRYEPGGRDWIRGLSETFRDGCREEGQNPDADFMSAIGAGYMARAAYPKPGLIRVADEAAKEMAARGDTVLRLLPSGAWRLSQIDAVQPDIWKRGDSAFAIKPEDIAGLERWAARAVKETSRQIQRENERGGRGKGAGRKKNKGEDI